MTVKFEMKKYEDLEALPEALPEAIDPERFIIATYYMALPPGLNAREIAQIAAIEQTTGTWTPVPGETPEVRKRSVGKVMGVYEAPYFEHGLPRDITERQYIVQIAYPAINIGAQLPMMLTTTVGNLSAGGKIKLLDLRFPQEYVANFPGPQFGIEGVRDALGIPKRPLVNNMIKPCTGFTAEVGAQYFYEAARGGVDIVKDDELIANASFNTLEERITAYMEAADRANEEKGEKTLYTVNITDDVSRILENADLVQELGANAMMINYVTVGFSATQMLIEDPSVKVPVLGHMDFGGAMYMGESTGVASHIIIGKFARMIGMDIALIPASMGKAPFLEERYLQAAHALTFPMYDLKPAFPMAGGGVTVAMVPDILETLGRDAVIGVGGGIHAHPMGPAAGARAFRQAIDAIMSGSTIKRAKREHEELKVALETWG